MHASISIILEITLAVFSVTTAIFSIFNYFKNPQILSDKNDALMNQSISQLQLDLTNLRDNHLHTLDTRVSGIVDSVNAVSIEVAKLGVIVQERLPANKNI